MSKLAIPPKTANQTLLAKQFTVGADMPMATATECNNWFMLWIAQGSSGTQAAPLSRCGGWTAAEDFLVAWCSAADGGA